MTWQTELPGAITPPILLNRGDTCFFGQGGWLRALAPNGSMLWQRSVDAWMVRAMLFPDGSIGASDGSHLRVYSRAEEIIGKQSGELTAVTIDDTTSFLISRTRAALATLTRATYATPLGYAKDVNVRVAVPDTFPRWIERRRYGATRVADDETIQLQAAPMPGGRSAISTGARIVVLRLADGTPVAEYVVQSESDLSGHAQPERLSGPAAGADGTLYAFGSDRFVYALRDTVAR